VSRATALISKLNAALNRVGPPERTVYKRVITRTGGDSLIGRPGSVSTADTILSPQPLYQRLGRFVVGDSAASQELLSNGKERVADDYQVIFSSTAVTQADLNNKDLQFVFKDAAGNSEVFRVTDFEPVGMNGVQLMFITYLRSTQRP
jgi:hypothetical protein